MWHMYKLRRSSRNLRNQIESKKDLTKKSFLLEIAKKRTFMASRQKFKMHCGINYSKVIKKSVQLYVNLFWWCKKCNLKCFCDFQTKDFIKHTKCFYFCMFYLPYTIHLVQGTGHPWVLFHIPPCLCNLPIAIFFWVYRFHENIDYLKKESIPIQFHWITGVIFALIRLREHCLKADWKCLVRSKKTISSDLKLDKKRK